MAWPDRAEYFENVMSRGKIENVMDWAGHGRLSSSRNTKFRAGPRPMIFGLYIGRFALPLRPPTRFDGPARPVGHEMYQLAYEAARVF